VNSIAPSAGVSTLNQNIISSAIYIKNKHCYFYLQGSQVVPLFRSAMVDDVVDRTDA